MRKLKRNWIVLMALALLLGGFGQAAQADFVDAATAMNIGPLNPQTTFPLWVQDSTGLTLEICPGTDPVHCISVPPFTTADIPPLTQALVDFSQQIGFGDEGFWASADAIVPTAAGSAILVSAVEAAFLPDFAPGNQFPFTRLRIRVDVPAAGGDFTVTHPWGHIHYTVPPGGTINDSFDIQFFPDQLGYQGRIGPILTWDSYPTDPILDTSVPRDGIADHIGDLATGPHAVKGSPLGTNFFRVEGPNIGGPGVNLVETNLFVVTGKVFTGVAPAALFVDRTTYARTVDGQVDVFARSAPTASVSVSGGANLNGPHPLTGDGTGLFFASAVVGDAGTLPASVTVTANNPGNGQTDLIVPLTDLVTVTLAEYDRTTQTLTVNATSSDQSPTNAPTLSLSAFGPFPAANLAGGAIAVGPVAAPPANVTVVSTAGGQATAPVSVVAGVTPGNRPPSAVNDIANTLEDTAVVITVLANDSDPDAPANTIDPTTVTIGGTGPANGTAVVNTTTGAVTYTPKLNFNGSDSFTYVVRDTLGAFSNVATVTISIDPVNDPPTAVNDAASVNINNSVTINVLANDTDPESNIVPGTVTIVSQGTRGTATAQPNGTVIYAAGATAGVDTFTYTVRDGANATSNVATVTVNVNNVAAEVVTITQAQFRTGQSRWTITGTTTVPGPGNQMTAILVRTGQTIGSAVVTAAGAFTIDVRNSPVVPRAGDVVRVTSTFGGTATQTVSIRN
jgi:hypothetical protein